MAKTATKATGGFIELVKTLVYAIAIALFIRTFFYEPFSIPSASMVPTLLVGDYLFVSKFSYGYSRYSMPYGYLIPTAFGSGPARLFYRAPHRGDVVVFKLPCDYSRLEKTNPSEAEYLKDSCSTSTDFIKRIIGLPGDSIQIVDGTVYVNGKKLDEPYVPDEYRDHVPLDKKVVPADKYFVLGDHRSSSNDSRVWGFVDRKEIYGKAVFVYWPPDKIGRVR